MRLFIPPISTPKGPDIHFKDRVRGRAIPVGPKCNVCGNHPTRVQFYNTKATTEWEEHVAREARNQLRFVHLEDDFLLPIESARIIISVRFTRRKPSSYPKSVLHNVVKPDVDNLMKGLLDGLVKGGIIRDDSMVTDEKVAKRYPEVGHPVGVEVDLTALGI